MISYKILTDIEENCNILVYNKNISSNFKFIID